MGGFGAAGAAGAAGRIAGAGFGAAGAAEAGFGAGAGAGAGAGIFAAGLRERFTFRAAGFLAAVFFADERFLPADFGAALRPILRADFFAFAGEPRRADFLDAFFAPERFLALAKRFVFFALALPLAFDAFFPLDFAAFAIVVLRQVRREKTSTSRCESRD